MKDPDKNNQPLDAVLRRAMRQPPGPATPECADAESLAAYSERSLPVPERERLETHFADCMRCQVMLADIARAEESAGSAKSAFALNLPWYRRWRVALPALAAVAAVVFLISMRHPANDEVQRDQLVAMAKQEAPAAELAASTSVGAPAAPAAAPVPRPAAPAVAGAMLASREAAQPAGAANAAPRALSASTTAMLMTISPPGGSVAWIVGKNGMIRHRDANGGIEMQRSGVSTDLIAGAAPSATVCWIVGRSGTIIRTTDGRHWTPVTSPTADNLTVVAASSANDATIATTTGQKFATADGGATWHQQ